MSAIENDRLKRIVLTGIIVVAAWLVRLIMFPDMRFFQHVVGSIALIVLVQIFWEIFKAIHKFLNKKLPFSEKLYLRIGTQLSLGILVMMLFVAIIISFLSGSIPLPITNISKGMMIVSQVLISIVINMTFISDYFITQWKAGILSAERFEKERSEMKYHHLKNQVNPHFLFNALTSLDALIKDNPDLASRYVGHMAKVYRYVLEHSEREIVPLKTELEFVGHYLSLQKIRFADALQIQTTVSASAAEKSIVMVTLQLLIDNAIKHNEIHKQFPLYIHIYDDDEYLIVKNKKQIRKVTHSSKQGLQQLRELYEYLTDRPVIVMNEDNHFTVKVPLL